MTSSHSNKRLSTRRLIILVYKVCIVAALMFVAYWILQVTTTCSFHTPSGSMTPTLLPNESGLVNKWKMGARIFNISDALNGKPFDIKRLPGYGKLDRGDIIIFNFPYLGSDYRRDSIVMNLGTYYCKRAVAVAGDTLEIRDCFYHVRGCDQILGVEREQRKLQQIAAQQDLLNIDTKNWPEWMMCQPYDSIFGWTVKDLGPLVIPMKGMTMEIDRRNYLLYKKYIEWETKEKTVWENSKAYLADIPIKYYTFTENYCFAAGDNVIDSNDSRYFGLVPEKFIVGTAGILWKSKDCKRLFKRLNTH